MELRHRFWREQGQSLIVVTLMLVVLLGFLGLVLDGGNFWAQRRFVQNGTDAGALAGARTLASTKDAGAATLEAQRYATTRNGLGDPTDPKAHVTAEVVIQGATVMVTVTKVYKTYFLSVVGISSFTMRARADAGYTPAGGVAGLMPIAVKKSAIDEIRAKGGGSTFIYMDDKEASDYSINKIADGERGWVNFDGGAVAESELSNWIMAGGYPGTVTVPTWINGSPGVSNAALQNFNTLVGQVILLPVYDAVRPKDGSLGSGNTDYHFVSFAAFRVTDVLDTGNPKWMKGEFLDDVVVGPPGGGYDTGVYVVGLQR